jgi:hypothetical protein
LTATGTLTVSSADDLMSATGLAGGEPVTGSMSAIASSDVAAMLGRVFGGLITDPSEERILGLIGKDRVLGLEGEDRTLALIGKNRTLGLEGKDRTLPLVGKDRNG